VVKETLAAVTQLAGKDDPRTFSKLILPRFERAAYADLGCSALEVTLVPWALKSVGDQKGAPGVRAELERIRSEYVPASNDKTLYSSMQTRVREYAAQLLTK
jgi:hypothetical protein